MNAQIKKQELNVADSKFGTSTSFYVVVNNTTWNETREIHCSNNTEFVEQINKIKSFWHGHKVSYKIVEKRQPKPAFRKMCSTCVVIELTITGQRHIQAGSYQSAKEIQEKYN